MKQKLSSRLMLIISVLEEECKKEGITPYQALNLSQYQKNAFNDSNSNTHCTEKKLEEIRAIKLVQKYFDNISHVLEKE